MRCPKCQARVASFRRWVLWPGPTSHCLNCTAKLRYVGFLCAGRRSRRAWGNHLRVRRRFVCGHGGAGLACCSAYLFNACAREHLHGNPAIVAFRAIQGSWVQITRSNGHRLGFSLPRNLPFLRHSAGSKQTTPSSKHAYSRSCFERRASRIEPTVALRAS
jgi:hypothetical protein